MSELILTKAQIVLRDEVVRGTWTNIVRGG